jgi:proline dehydrogenase
VPRLTRNALFGLVTSRALERAVRAVPPVRRLTLRAARRYIAGERVDDGLRLTKLLLTRGLAVSVDFFGELVDDPEAARRASDDYVALAQVIRELPSEVWLAIDLSHIGLDVSADFCLEQLRRIAAALSPGRRIQIGAEDSSRTERTLEVVLAAAELGLPVMATVQANLRRSSVDAMRLVDAGVPIRLVKGAYVEPADVALPWGEPTDVAYVRLAHQIREAGGRLALATHDRVLRESLLSAFGRIDCELLLGVRNEDADDLVRRGLRVRFYVPYGDAWFRYFMRRLAESRGA